MEALQVTKENALKAFDEGSDQDKALLSRLFGKSVFSRNIMNRVKTYEDACAVLGVDSSVPLRYLTDLASDNTSMNAYFKLMVIARALNEGWTPDWSNSNQWKYYPWMKYSAGSGFSFGDYGRDHSTSFVGSRLVFKSKELAEYAGSQFKDIYNEFFLL